jgi:hypothetical protein
MSRTWIWRRKRKAEKAAEVTHTHKERESGLLTLDLRWEKERRRKRGGEETGQRVFRVSVVVLSLRRDRLKKSRKQKKVTPEKQKRENQRP